MTSPSLRRCLAVGSLALATLAAGCARGSDESTESGSGDPTTSVAERPTITIVTYDSYVLDKAVKAEVEERLGVRIEISATGDGAEALAAAVLTAGRPEGDIFFGVDNMLMGRALAEPVFEAFDPAVVTNLGDIPDELRLDSSGHLVPVDVGPVCIDYDAGWFAANDMDPPASLEDLAKPEYASKLVLTSPITSTPGLAFLMATGARFGDGAEEYWRSLIDGGAEVVGGWSEAWYERYTVNGGEFPLVLSYASSPPAEVFYSEGDVTEPASGIVESTCVDQIEFAGVLNGTDEPELANAVLNEMLSIAWQESLPLTNFVYPVHPGAALPELFAEFAPRPTNSLLVDPSIIEAERDGWIDAWRTFAR